MNEKIERNNSGWNPVQSEMLTGKKKQIIAFQQPEM